jgi:probable HAF family extracellular repeat protein
MQFKFTVRLTIGAFAAMTLCGISAAQAPSYTVKQVHPEFKQVTGEAFNDKAKVGASILKKGKFIGAVCSAKVCTEVPVLPGAPQGEFARIHAINKLGHVAGSSSTDKAWEHALVFDGVETQEIGAFDEDDCGGCSLTSWATGINDKGQVVGNSETGQGGIQGFVWKKGVMTKLPTLGGSWSNANAINENGVVAGVAEVVPGTWHAVIYRKGRAQDLGALGTGTAAGANDINNFDVVVGGSATDGQNGGMPFIYSAGEMRQLPLPAGASEGTATHINDAGWVVGSFSPTGQSHGRGWVFDGHEAYDLNSLIPAADQAQWVIGGASGINASGQILVSATKPGNQFITYALILTPQAPAR